MGGSSLEIELFQVCPSISLPLQRLSDLQLSMSSRASTQCRIQVQRKNECTASASAADRGSGYMPMHAPCLVCRVNSSLAAKHLMHAGMTHNLTGRTDKNTPLLLFSSFCLLGREISQQACTNLTTAAVRWLLLASSTMDCTRCRYCTEAFPVDAFLQLVFRLCNKSAVCLLCWQMCIAEAQSCQCWQT